MPIGSSDDSPYCVMYTFNYRLYESETGAKAMHVTDLAPAIIYFLIAGTISLSFLCFENIPQWKKVTKNKLKMGQRFKIINTVCSFTFLLLLRIILQLLMAKTNTKVIFSKFDTNLKLVLS